VQLGSGGFAIAHQVADRLGYRYFDWEITSEAAARAGVSPADIAASERVPSFLERIMRRLLSASAIGTEESSVVIAAEPALVNAAVQSLGSEDYRRFIERVVVELADHGDAVIVGHAAAVILKDKPGTLKVLIHGSPGERTRRLASEQDLTPVEAEQLIRQSDKDRLELFSRAYKINWLDATNYDLAFKTDRSDEGLIVDTILDAVNAVP
jgi:cytidylate kinase